MKQVTLYTVGHSNRESGELLALLGAAGVVALVDVRAHPQSRRHPQFGQAALREAAEAARITYHWAGRQLGGRRRTRPESPHRALAEDGLRGYADYMDSAEFAGAAGQLLRLAGRAPTAVLCAERLPEDCHRSLIADYLMLQGARVLHLIDDGELREHRLRPEARRESSRLVYDRNVSAALHFG
ncbi:MAG: DUF488 domain-containing protein [Gammaproteobacteria bacterium]